MDQSHDILNAIKALVAAAENDGWDLTENSDALAKGREAYADLCAFFGRQPLEGDALHEARDRGGRAMSAAGCREGDGGHAIVAHEPGTRHVVSLGKDEIAQLAVAGSLCLAAPRFAAIPDPELITEPELDYLEDVHAAPGWTTSLRPSTAVADK